MTSWTAQDWCGIMVAGSFSLLIIVAAVSLLSATIKDLRK